MVKKNVRARTYNVVFYSSEKDLDCILLKNTEGINRYAYILHDKDLYTEDVLNDKGEIVHKAGELKKAHFHVLIDFINAHTFTSVKRIFTTAEDNPRVEKVTDRVAFFRYLTHKDEKNAYKYPDSAIVSNDIKYYQDLEKRGDFSTHSDCVAVQIIEDLRAKVPLKQMMYKYGRDFIINYQKYKDFAWAWEEDDKLNKYDENNMPFD